MSKKYQVVSILEKRNQLQEVYYTLDHYEWDESKEEFVDKSGRYKAYAEWEAQEILDSYWEDFEFDHYPTIAEVEEILLKCLKLKAEYFEDYVMKYLKIYDSEQEPVPSNSSCKSITEKYDKELYDTLSYHGEYEVYIGDIEDIEVEVEEQ